MPAEKPMVLFLCVNNSLRSQMAEALLRHHAGDRFASCSAGLAPRPVHRLVPEVLAEIGVDASHLETKPLRSFLARRGVRWAVILRAVDERNAPRLFPFAARTLRWEVPDPGCDGCSEVASRDAMRRTRDDIDARVRAWLAELDGAARTSSVA